MLDEFRNAFIVTTCAQRVLVITIECIISMNLVVSVFWYFHSSENLDSYPVLEWSYDGVYRRTTQDSRSNNTKAILPTNLLVETIKEF
jgi:hypothetical protein